MDTERRTVLLVDDDASLLITLGDLLRYEGYRVETAENAERALDTLDGLAPDLIILDISMPGMGGLGFLRALAARAGAPRPPVLVLTARATIQDSPAGLGVEGYMAKPCDPRRLLDEIGRILLRRPPPTRAGGERAQSRTVLLGEDDPSIRDRIATALQDDGCAVSAVGSGPELIEKAILERPDLILLKLSIGNLQGDAVAGIIRSMPKTSGIPVVLYGGTGAGAPETRAADPAPGVCRFVRTAEAEALTAVVRDVLRAREAG